MGIGEFFLNIILFHAFRLAGQIPFLFRQLLKIAAHVIPVIRIPAVRAAAQAEIIAAVQVPFADVGGVYALIRQPAPNILYIIGQPHAVGPACAGMGIAPCEYGGAGRLTDGLGGVRLFKTDAILRQPVQRRRFHIRVSVAAQHIRALGIGHNKNHFFLVHIAPPGF